MTDNHSMPWDGVTEADREAAASGYYAWCSGNRVIPSKMLAGAVDDHSMVQAFARHRQLSAAAERARIVAWLRKEADALAIEQANTRQGSPDWLCLREQVEDHQLIADAIERGEV